MQIYYTELESNRIDKTTSHQLLAASLVKYWESCPAGMCESAGDCEMPEVIMLKLDDEGADSELAAMAEKLVAEMSYGEFGKPEFSGAGGAKLLCGGATCEEPGNSDAVQSGETCRLRELPVPHFSISHSDNAWAVMFSEQACGLDIQFEVSCKYDRLASRLYGAEEAELIHSLAEDEKIQEFFRHWTRREAYIKALGISVFRDAEHEGMNCSGVSVSRDGRRWRVYNIHLPINLYAAVCVSC